MIRKRRRLELRKTLFLLPNLITLSSIFCGFLSIRQSAAATTGEDFYPAALLIIAAMFFDTLDGRVARMTKTQSAFGLQIDSLADIVSFGVAPSVLVYEWTLHRFDTAGLIVAFLFTACGAIRLARFNVLAMGEGGKPSKPSKYIIGLPIPGAAGILVSIVVANHAVAGAIGGAEYAAAILGITIVLSLLMVSTIRFRSFKDLRLNARTAALVAFAIGSSVVISMQMKPAFVLVWLLGFYVMLGIVESLWQLPARLRGVPVDARSSSASLPPRDSAPPAEPQG
jgi:CDP-diacylglycerol--serine O-phosphatidyltransferase